MPSVFAKKVIAMLTPSIGAFMATRKVIRACDMANVDIEKLGPSQKKKFSQKMALTCSSFGPTIAKSIKKKVEAL